MRRRPFLLVFLIIFTASSIFTVRLKCEEDGPLNEDEDEAEERQCMGMAHSNYLPEGALHRVCKHRAMWIRDHYRKEDQGEQQSLTGGKKREFYQLKMFS
jgi:hypothetical protein